MDHLTMTRIEALARRLAILEGKPDPGILCRNCNRGLNEDGDKCQVCNGTARYYPGGKTMQCSHCIAGYIFAHGRKLPCGSCNGVGYLQSAPEGCDKQAPTKPKCKWCISGETESSDGRVRFCSRCGGTGYKLSPEIKEDPVVSADTPLGPCIYCLNGWITGHYAGSHYRTPCKHCNTQTKETRKEEDPVAPVDTTLGPCGYCKDGWVYGLYTPHYRSPCRHCKTQTKETRKESAFVLLSW